MSSFKVSVIIPVYNAERFLIESVNSAIRLGEVGEVILIEDRSPDNALELCKKLEAENKKVRLLTHPNNENLGAGASRNLGIKNAKFEYIAFLDADDKYLPNRFKKEKEKFRKYNKIDAVYSKAVLKNEKNEILREYGFEDDIRTRIGVEAKPKKFYRESLKIKKSLFHTNSITFKKSFLLKNKLFDERLRLHQDSELWKRLLRVGYFFSGELRDPVAEVKAHENNRITTRSTSSALKMNAVFIENVGIINLYNFEKVSLLKSIIRHKSKSIAGKWKRRLYYYSRFLFSSFDKDKFLNKFLENGLND